MRCPRCHGETGYAAIRCADCGAPLALPPEPAARPLDRDLRHDRRGTMDLGAEPEHEVEPTDPALVREPSRQKAPPLLAIPPPGTPIVLRRAPTLRRLAVWIVDGLPFLLLVVALAVGLGVSTPALLLQVAAVAAIASFAYQTLGCWLQGATFGLRWLHLRVAGPDGGRPSLARSAARAAAAVVGAALLGLFPLAAIFARSGRGLHDLIAGTALVDAP